MATRAVTFIQLFAARGGFEGRTLDNAEHPGHLVGIGVEQASLRIEGRPTPLLAAIHSGKQNRSLLTAWDELPVATILLKSGQSFRMRFRRPRRYAVRIKTLPCEWRWCSGQRLRLRRVLARNVAGRIGLLFDGENW